MSEDTDKSSKTEEPTAKKLADACEKGSVAVSREINTFMLLLAGCRRFDHVCGRYGGGSQNMLLQFIERPHAIPFDGGNMIDVLSKLLIDFLRILSLPFILFTIVAIGAGVIQNGFSFSPKALQPKLSKFNPITGAKRIFSGKQVVEFIKGIFKINCGKRGDHRPALADL